MQRREMIQILSVLAASGALASPALGQTATGASAIDETKPMDMSKVPQSWFGDEQVAIVIYDDMTALDVIGPQYFLSGLFGATVHMVARTEAPITSDSGITIAPTATFETCPKDLDVLLVGGGVSGTLAAMRDDTTLDFLADRGARAQWVTSVCTGSLLLGQAGLLKGYRATSHWIGRPLLDRFGAIEVNERMVFDRNRATGAGVSAGLDLGLELMHRMRPLDLAQAMQVMAEYAPEPPLDFGTPEKVPADVLAGIEDRMSGFTEAVRSTARSARI